MKTLRTVLMAAGCAALLVLGAGNAMAQGRGNWDPAQFKQRMMDNLREQMDIKDDQEWQAIEPKLGKVFDARGEVMAMGFRGGMGGGRRRNGGGGDNNGGDNQGQQRRNRFGEPSANLEALQKAIEDKAPTAEIKTKLAAVRAEIKDKQAKLLAAQEELRSILTPRQEAIATVNGLLQ
jgi:DNA-binding FrmR family transcriptional regulator